MSVFDMAAGTLASDRNIGSDATYFPDGGAGAPIPGLRVIRSRPIDVVPGRASGSSGPVLVSIPIASLPSPVRLDRLQIGSTLYRIEEIDRDEEEAMWSLTLSGVA